MNQVFWHNLSWQKVVEKLNSNEKEGLSEKEVKERQRKFGENKITKEKPESKLKLFLSQFKSPLIYILIFVGLIVLILEKPPQNFIEASFVFFAIFINAIFGFFEEYKASNTFEKLRKILKTKAKVLREGRKKEIFQEEIVPGDIIILNSGDKIPADARVIEAQNLKVSEAVLTGEWLAASKKTEILPKETPLAERKNMVYAGSLVESGEGKAIVVAIGQNTQMGKISLLLKETKEEESPLQKKLTHFGKIIGGIIVIVCLLIFLIGLFKGLNPLKMFEISAAIAVGGIPEALPVVMTLILALGMGKLAKKRGLIKKLASVETLGSTSIICCDKTKTLTQGKMEVDEVVTFKENFEIKPQSKEPVFNLALKIAILCNQAFVENPEDNFLNWKIRGSPTDKALILAGAKAGILKSELEKKISFIENLPFDPSKKYLALLFKEDKKFFLYISGAPERILELSSKIETKERLTSENLKILQKKLEDLVNKGKRVIGLAYKEIEEKDSKKKIEDLIGDFNFVAFFSLKDPLRADVKEAIKISQKAGILPIIVTGDHKATALTVAKELQMKVKEENVIEGKDLDRLSDKDFEKIISKIRIYARTEPRHKIRIVKVWQKKGEVVAMTGDGVNDAPALKKADIGVALGSGTEVAKEAADLILLDDSFEIIVKAIEEGRVILDNLRKAITLIMGNAFASATLVGMSLLFGWPLPILWTQILWNNLVEDTLPDIAYGFEKKEKGVMERGPTPSKAPLLTKEMKILIFGIGLIRQFLILGLFWLLWSHLKFPLDYVRTIVFGSIVIDTAFVMYSFKNLRKNIWQINIFDNKLLLLSTFVIFGTFCLAVYFSPFQRLLQTVPIGFGSWLILIGVGLLAMILIEIVKWFFIKKKETE
jgi:Ca2+-transporting ATPase